MIWIFRWTILYTLHWHCCMCLYIDQQSLFFSLSMLRDSKWQDDPRSSTCDHITFKLSLSDTTVITQTSKCAVHKNKHTPTHATVRSQEAVQVNYSVQWLFTVITAERGRQTELFGVLSFHTHSGQIQMSVWFRSKQPNSNPKMCVRPSGWCDAVR